MISVLLKNFHEVYAPTLTRTQIKKQNITTRPRPSEKSPCAPFWLPPPACLTSNHRLVLLAFELHVNGILQIPSAAWFLSLNYVRCDHVV